MKKVLSSLYCILSLCLICFHPTNAQSAEDETSAPKIREIVFDLETTGLKCEEGHKIVEIGAVELINHVPTGKKYQQYVNPMRNSSKEALEDHGLSKEFLSSYPTFSEIAQDFLDFIGKDSVLIAHNGKKFDVPFISCELERNGFQTLENYEVIDTLDIAKDKFPEEPHNLNYLCSCFNIDNSDRVKHGALLDTELLAKVYVDLLNETPTVCPSAIIKQAIAENKKLEMIYEDSSKKVTTRTIIPNRMEYGKTFNEEGKEDYPLKDDKVYIKAYCELDQANRTFRLDRIIHIRMLP